MLSLTTTKSSVLVGVLISVTTVPAAANVGVAAAVGRWDECLGAATQLAVNLVSLLLAGVATLTIQRQVWHRWRRINRAKAAQERHSLDLALNRSTELIGSAGRRLTTRPRQYRRSDEIGSPALRVSVATRITPGMIRPESSVAACLAISIAELHLWRTARDSNPQPPDPEPGALRRSGRLQTDLACSRWVGRRSDGSRRVPSDRLDDQADSSKSGD